MNTKDKIKYKIINYLTNNDYINGVDAVTIADYITENLLNQQIEEEKERVLREFAEWVDKMGVMFVPVYLVGTKFEDFSLEDLIEVFIKETKDE